MVWHKQHLTALLAVRGGSLPAAYLFLCLEPIYCFHNQGAKASTASAIIAAFSLIVLL
jgi:hypothetical protein